MKNSFIVISLLLIFSCNVSISQDVSWIVKPTYSSIRPFNDNIAAVCGDNGKCGYVSQSGKVVDPPQYDVVYDFCNGYGVITDKDNLLIAIVDVFGNIISINDKVFIYPRTAYFNNGMLLVNDGQKDLKKIKYGYINTSGQLAIDLKYTAAHPFSEGLAAVTNKEFGSGGWAFINTFGQGQITQGNLDCVWASSFIDGKALVIKNGKFKFIYNSKAADKKKIDLSLTQGSSFNPSTGQMNCAGGFVSFDRFGCAEYYNINNEIVYFNDNPLQNQQFDTFFKDDKYGFTLKKGKIPAQFDNVIWSNSISKLAIVKLNGKCGVIIINNDPSVCVSLESDKLTSIYGNPVSLYVNVKNTGTNELDNLSLTFNGENKKPIKELTPNTSQQVEYIIHKSGKHNVVIDIEKDGIKLEGIESTISVADSSAIDVSFPTTNYYYTEQECLVSISVINMSDLYVAKNVLINITTDGLKTYDTIIAEIPSGMSMPVSFEVYLIEDCVKKISVAVKAENSIERLFKKEISFTEIEEKTVDEIEEKTIIQIQDDINKQDKNSEGIGIDKDN